MQVKTVKVSNVSLSASQQDIEEFFSFSGEIIYVELRRLFSLTHIMNKHYRLEMILTNLDFTL